MRPLHVVQFIPTLIFGGAERAVVDLVNATDPARVKFTLVLFFDNQPLAKDLVPGRASLRIVPKKNLFGIGLRGAVRAALKELKPDLVHTHTFSADIWGRLAAHDLGLPIVTTEHNINADEGVVRSFLKRRYAAYSDAYAACSESVREYIVRVYGVKKPITVIPWGIALDRFKDVPPPKYRKPFRLLILGRLAPQKGHDIALDALARLKDVPWELSIVGDGALRTDLERRVGALGLRDRVAFAPATLDVPGLFGRTDLLLMPSRWEGLGIVAMEGMAAGRPVIASDVDGLAGLIRDGETGFLAQPTADGFERVLRKAFDDPSLCRRIAAQAEDYAYAHFDIKTEVARYEELYWSVLKH